MNNDQLTQTQQANRSDEGTSLVEPTYQSPRYTSRYDETVWEVAVFLPGAKKEDVEANIADEVLEIVAKRQISVPEGWRALAEYETETHWRLRLDVGPEVDGGQVSASMDNGVLRLRLPLREEAKPRRIEIL